MIEVFAKAVGVGVAIAAPVGPIGILCIRNTIAHGRSTGLATGFGAAAADGVYGIVVAAGLAATGVLMTYDATLRLVGASLLIILGLMTLRGFLKSGETAPAEVPSKRASAAFAGTFALTLSNPMTMMAFIAWISTLGTSAGSDPAAPYFIVAGIFLGSALWWLFLVHAALVAKKRITRSVTRWLDLVSGVILTGWGGWLLVSAGL